jgi:hypothetical protein
LQPQSQAVTEYPARLTRWIAEAEKRAAVQNRLGTARVWIGVAFAIVTSIALGPAWFSPWWILLPAVPLVITVAMHGPKQRALLRARRLAAYYERGVAKVEDRWAGTGSKGDAWFAPDHVYASDLDLYGRGSLFERLSTARTATGERTLAGWLSAPGDVADVRARQQAVEELRSKLDLREDLAVLGEDIRAALDDRRVAAWGSGEAIRFWSGAPWVALVLALAAVTAAGAWALGLTTLRWFFIVALVEMLFAGSMRKQIGAVTEAVNTPARELRLIAELLGRIERETFVSPPLVELQRRLSAGTTGAAEQIGRLERLVEWKEWAHNQIFGVIAAPLLWVPQFAMAIERWRQQCGPHIGEWIAVAGEFEALMSLAAFAYERPDAVFPSLDESTTPKYDARAVVHPLIAPREAVANDVALGEERLWIISGSNMSGKSTLLRAVGLSVAMAWAGAPVTAGALRLTRLRVGASLRANDSLADHQSRFYAEIRRLKQVVDLAASGQTLFLLDELLSGTNSHDRRIGAEALLRGLLQRGAIGLATTHDLALAEIAQSMSNNARNVHFEDQFESGAMKWDYRLRPGTIAKGNALELMRAVGLEV